MKWVTREKVKVDRVACPWLIRKFIDPQAEFLFVPAEHWRIGPLGRGTPAQSARRGLLHLRISGQRQAVTELRERGYDARALVGGTSTTAS